MFSDGVIQKSGVLYSRWLKVSDPLTLTVVYMVGVQV
jgi:hypothetical protein